MTADNVKWKEEKEKAGEGRGERDWEFYYY